MRCVHCGAGPYGTIFRRYGAQTIKLLPCTRCHLDIDPYFEREELLVALDLLLFRNEAYIHVLANLPLPAKTHSLIIAMLGALLEAILTLQMMKNDDITALDALGGMVSHGLGFLVMARILASLWGIHDNAKTLTVNATLWFPSLLYVVPILMQYVWNDDSTPTKLISIVLVGLFQCKAIQNVANIHNIQPQSARLGIFLTFLVRINVFVVDHWNIGRQG